MYLRMPAAASLLCALVLTALVPLGLAWTLQPKKAPVAKAAAGCKSVHRPIPKMVRSLAPGYGADQACGEPDLAQYY